MRSKRTHGLGDDHGLRAAIGWVGEERIRRCARLAGGHYGGRAFWHAAVGESARYPKGSDDREKYFGIVMIALICPAARIRRALRFRAKAEEVSAGLCAAHTPDPPVELWAAEAALGEDQPS